MANVTSLVLHEVTLGKSDEVFLACRFIRSFPSLSALTFNCCALGPDFDPNVLEALDTIESLYFCECLVWGVEHPLDTAPNSQLNIPWRIRSLSLDNCHEGPIDFFNRHPIALKFVKRFAFRHTGFSWSVNPLQLVHQMRENVEELEIVGGEGYTGPKPSRMSNLLDLSNIPLKIPTYSHRLVLRLSSRQGVDALH